MAGSTSFFSALAQDPTIITMMTTKAIHPMIIPAIAPPDRSESVSAPLDPEPP